MKPQQQSNPILKKLGLKPTPYVTNSVPPTGAMAIEALAKLHALTFNLDESGTIEAFKLHLQDSDASYILKNGRSHETIEGRLSRACRTAEDFMEMKQNQEVAAHIASILENERKRILDSE